MLGRVTHAPSFPRARTVGALLGLDMFAADGCSSLGVAQRQYACAEIVGRLLWLAPLLAVLIQKGRSIQAMDALTCVQSPIIVQSHESEVRPGRILFLLLPVQKFRNNFGRPIMMFVGPARGSSG